MGADPRGKPTIVLGNLLESQFPVGIAVNQSLFGNTTRFHHLPLHFLSSVSVDEAKKCVEQRCAEVLKVPGHLHWTVRRGRVVVVIRATLFRRIGRADGTA
jgi:hypothetical protein